MAYITIDQDGTDAATYVIDTNEQERAAREALRDAGLEYAYVFVGEPDGLGDSYKTDVRFWAAK